MSHIFSRRYNGWKYVGELFEKHIPNKEAYILCVGAGTGLEGVRLAQLGYKNMDAHDGSAEMLKVVIVVNRNNANAPPGR